VVSNAHADIAAKWMNLYCGLLLTNLPAATNSATDRQSSRNAETL